MANDSIDELLSEWGEDLISSNRPEPPSSRSSAPIFDDDESDDLNLTSMAENMKDDEDEDLALQPDYDQKEVDVGSDDSLPLPNIDSLPMPNLDSIYDENEETVRRRMPSKPINDDPANEDDFDDGRQNESEYDEFPSLDFPEQDPSADEVDLRGINSKLENIEESKTIGGSDHDNDDLPYKPNDDAEDLTDGDSRGGTNLLKTVKGKSSPMTKNHEEDERPVRDHRFRFPKMTASSMINAPLRLLRKLRKARRMYWIAYSLAGLFVVLWSFTNISAANSKGGAVDAAVNEGSVEVASATWKNGHVETVLKNKSDMIAHVAGEANVKTWSPDYRPASWVSPRVVMSCKIPQEDIDPGKSAVIKPNDCNGKVHGVWPRVQVRLDYQ